MKSKDSKTQNFFGIDRIFRDSHGNIVIGQFPNLHLAGWILCVILSHLIDTEPLAANFRTLGTAFGLIWSYLEITEGVNLFRSILGIIVFVALVIGVLM